MTQNNMAPIPNETMPIIPDRTERPIILRHILQSFVLYSSLYLKINDRKKPNSIPIVKNADTLVTHVSNRLICCSWLVKKVFVILVAIEEKPPLPVISYITQLTRPAHIPAIV